MDFHQQNNATNYAQSTLDLDFADDVVLIGSDVKRLQELTTAVEQEASRVGLCVNSNK